MPQFKLDLSSRDAIGATDVPSSCTLKLQGQGLRKVSKISLDYLAIPNVFYNIKTGVNDRFCWNRGGNFSYQIPAGFYDTLSLATSLPSVLQANMNSIDAGNSYVVSVSPVTGKMTISGTNAFVINNATNPQKATSCWRETGFLYNTDTASSTSQVSPNCVSLENPTLFFITIQEFGNYFISSSQSAIVNSSTFCIPLTQSKGSLVFSSKLSDIENVLELSPARNISTLHVAIHDRDGVQLDLNGSHWDMLLSGVSD